MANQMLRTFCKGNKIVIKDGESVREEPWPEAVICVVLALLSSVHNSTSDLPSEGMQRCVHMPGGVLLVALHEGGKAGLQQ